MSREEPRPDDVSRREPRPDEVTRVRAELAGLERAAVDASSIIYMLKAGFFGYVAAELSLYTVGPVAREVGWPELPVRIADLRRGGDVPWARETIDVAEAFVGRGKHGNDELLLELAGARDLAVVSEDRRLHERAAELGLPHYNALLMLAVAAARGRVDGDARAEYFEELARIGRYGADVLGFARAVVGI